MNIIPISVPTPFYVGDVNVYLIKDDPITLIDVGPKTDEAATALKNGLARNGLEFADIRRILLTHAHEDHCGLAKQIRDSSKNAEVLIHDWETGHLFGRLARDEHRRMLMRSGVPERVFDEMQGLYEQISLLTDSLADGDLSPLRDEMMLEFDSGSLQVMHTPGHTPGSCSFYREADRTVISGDCVLKRITPNPVVSPDPVDPNKRFPSLSEYLVSLARIRSLSPTLIHCGHGEAVTDYQEIFNRYVRAIDDRNARVVKLIGQSGSTAFDVARQLFPDSFDHDVHRFLAISEAIAHLDHATAEGRIGMELSDGVEFYRQN